MQTGKPIPRPTALSKRFWEGTRQGKLMLATDEITLYKFKPL
jgi:hypothetical protein